MHICIISPGFPSAEYPVYTFVAQLCRALAAQGHHVSVIAPQSVTKSVIRRIPLNARYRKECSVHGEVIEIYQPYYFSAGNSAFLPKDWNLRRFAGAVKRACRSLREKPDVFYGHFWHMAYTVFPIAKKYNIPLFVASGEAEIELHTYIRRCDLQSFVDYVRGVICVSSKNRTESIKAGLAEAVKCSVIPNAVDCTSFYPRNKSLLRARFGYGQNDFIVAFVGGFIHRKGANRLAEAITLLRDSGIKSIFIGATQDNDRCEPICDGILFKGRLPHEKIPDYLGCADVFVMPTLHEGCCNAIIEAMACGLPIISSDRDFNHDMLDETCSILIDPMNVREIAEAIRILREDTTKRERMSRRAIERAGMLTIDKRAERIIQFIQSHL